MTPSISLSPDLLQEFDEWLASRSLALSTRQSYLRALRVVAESTGGLIPLDREEADRAVEAAGGAPATQHRRRGALHRFADWRAGPGRLDDPGWLSEQYIVRGQSTRDIARICGCVHGTVPSALRRHEIPRREGAGGRPPASSYRRPRAPPGWREDIAGSVAQAVIAALARNPCAEGDVLIVPAHEILDPLLADPRYREVSRSWLQGQVTVAAHRAGGKTHTKGQRGALSYSYPRTAAERVAAQARAAVSLPEEVSA